MDWLVILENLLLVSGLLTVLASFALYLARTKDIKALLFFWQKRLALNPREFIVNRIGIGLMVSGIVIRLIYHIFFIGG